MKKIFAVPLSILILAVTLMGVTGRHAGNGTSSLSGGAISDLPLHDGTVFETSIRVPSAGMLGLGLHVRYPVSQEVAQEAVAVSVLGEDSGETVLDETLSLRNTGYAGDTVNEGVLLIPFPEPAEGSERLRLVLRGSGISEDSGFMLRIRSDPKAMGRLTCNGEETEGGLYLVAYTPGEAGISVSGLLPGIALSLLILLWGILQDRQEAKKRKAENHGDSQQDSQVSAGLPGRLRIPAKKWIVLILLLIVQAIVLEFGCYAGVRHSIDETVEQNRKSKNTIQLRSGEAISFPLPAQSRDLCGIGVNLKYDYHMDQQLALTVREENADQPLLVSIISMDEVLTDRNGDYQILYFPEVIHQSDKKSYVITLEYLSGNGALELTAAKQESKGEPAQPYVKVLYRNRVFLLKLYLLIAALTLAGTCLIWYCFAAGIDWKRWFPAAVSVTGICFMLLIKPYSVPDEYVHFDEAYKISNSLLGIGQSRISEGIYKRSCDICTDILSKEKMDGEAYRWERDTLRKEIKSWPNWCREDMELVYARGSGKSSSPVYYLPAAIGLTAGRLLGLGFMGVFYLARLFQFAAGAALAVFAVRRIPVGKPVLAALTFMPVTMMALASVSYDAIIIPACFACFALALQLILDPEEGTGGYVILLLIMTLLAGLSKAGVYLPIGVLSIYGIIRWYRAGAGSGKRLRGFGAVLTMALLAGIIALVLFHFGKIYLDRLDLSQGPVYNSRTENAGYSAAYLLAHPIQTLRILEGTVYWRTSMLFGIAGAGLGWVYTVALELALRIFFVIYAAFSCIRIKGEKVLSGKLRALCILLFLISAAGFHFAMLTGWTWVGSKYITGVASRYFLPVLPLLLVALRGRSPVYLSGRENCERNFAAAGYALSILAVVSFVITALG